MSYINPGWISPTRDFSVEPKSITKQANDSLAIRLRFRSAEFDVSLLIVPIISNTKLILKVPSCARARYPTPSTNIYLIFYLTYLRLFLQ